MGGEAGGQHGHDPRAAGGVVGRAGQRGDGGRPDQRRMNTRRTDGRADARRSDPRADARRSGRRGDGRRRDDRHAGGRRSGSRRAAVPNAALRPVLRRGSPVRRLHVTLLCIGFVLSLFVGRLVQLQGLDSARYRTLANGRRLTQIKIPAVRGTITASDGTILAMTVQTDQVFADPTRIPRSLRSTVASKLAVQLRMTPAQILGLLNHPSSPEYVILKPQVSMAAAGRIMALGLPGIALKASYQRSYPNGNLAASLLGFASANARSGDLQGAAGLEEQYNSLLAGKDGREEEETGALGQPIPLAAAKINPGVPARNLQLTIQPAIQYEAEQICQQRVRQTHARNCTIVVIQPGTGKILALAQWPTFSPAGPASYAATADIGVSSVFAPGSTAKVITVAAALERGGQRLMSAYTIPDQIVVDGYPFRDAETHPTTRYTVAGILARSSNVGMVQVVQHVSPQVQYSYLRAFGLGSPTGLGLPGESPGILPPPSQWTGGQAGERYELSFGQGIAVNAVQMASVYATIANGGVRVAPSIVAGTTSGSGKFTPAAAPSRRRVLKAKTARELIKILQQVPVVDEAANEPWGLIAGYSIAAKTGTAQEPSGKCLCAYGSSYIGIAPARHPQVVVAVNIQDPTARGYFGDQVAGPAFYNVMKFTLQTLKIPPDGGGLPYVRLTAP
jgi:cell division protein FtsI (penicillin-binding protein 3)